MKYTADISPAISELKKLHLGLVEKATENITGPLGNVVSGIGTGYDAARDTVISIVPKDRRRELGWYKFRMWEKKSDQLVAQLDPQFRPRKYHEIFIAGEALAGDSSDLVKLMIHQVIHQAASVASTRSYHGEWVKHWGQRLFKIPQEAWVRDEVMGWITLDDTKLGPEAMGLIARLAATVATENIDMFRDLTAATQTTGRMYLWQCKCKPKVRTGGILQATCDKCGSKFLFQDAAKADGRFIRRIPLGYLPHEPAEHVVLPQPVASDFR